MSKQIAYEIGTPVPKPTETEYELLKKAFAEVTTKMGRKDLKALNNFEKNKIIEKIDTSSLKELDSTFIKESNKMNNNTANMNRDHLEECACFGCEKPKCRGRYTSKEWHHAGLAHSYFDLCRHCGSNTESHAGYWTTEGVFVGGSCRIKHLLKKLKISKTFKRYNNSFSSEYVFEK